MHGGWLFAISTLLIAPTAASVILLEDQAGDGTIAGLARTDILRLEAAWADQAIDWTLVTGTESREQEVGLLDSMSYEITFRLGGQDYAMRVVRGVAVVQTLDTASLSYELHRIVKGGRTVLEAGPVTEDRAEGAFTWSTGTDALRDEQDLPLGPGRSITDFVVEAQFVGVTVGLPGPNGDMSLQAPEDRMPDTGSGDVALTVPPAPVPPVYLLPDAPVRTSNGAPTTLVYALELVNDADQARTFVLDASDVPDGWRITVWPDAVKLAPGDRSEVQVLVETSGTHLHGDQDVFTVTARGLDGSEATAPLTLHYPTIPDVSGHHPRLWIHTAAPPPNPVRMALEPINSLDVAGWMNAALEDPSDEDLAISARYQHDVSRSGWTLPLMPAPRTGFAFDSGDAKLSIELAYRRPAPMATHSFEVILEAMTADETFAVAGPVHVEDLDLSSPQTIDLALPMALETIPFRPELEMRLRVLYDYQDTDVQSVVGFNELQLLPGGYLDLPAREYHDPLPPDAAALFQVAETLDHDGSPVDEAGDTPVSQRTTPAPATPWLLLASIGALQRARRRQMP